METPSVAGRDEKRPKGRKDKKEKKQRDPEDRSRKTLRRSSRSRQCSPPQAASGQKVPQPSAAQHAEEAVLGRKDSILSDKGQEGRSKAAWREELNKAEGAAGDDGDAPEGIVEDENEDDVAKRLQESRLRREALIAKWVNRGETANGGSGTLETPDTTMGEVISDSDDEGVFSEEKPQEVAAEEPLDEESLQLKKDLQRFILQHKAEQDNMFDETADEDAIRKKASGQDAAISQTGASADDWDDADGYYRAKIGEVMNDRYLVTEDICGKGVFSNVCKATDKTDNSPVAIKIMRCNDMMKKAAEKEVDILERLNKADKQNKKHVIKMLRHFMYRGHLCLVFECMWDNLRVALKKYTKDKGMSLQAVRAYTRQLLIALRHLHRCQIIHSDIKPDNILISAGHNVVKICDLGSAMELTEVEPTPYLVSRFYRAPEIVLAAKYSFPLDVFAMGCTLFELFTGKILFQGKNNNDMMRLFMEVKGKLPNKLIKSGNCWKQHFDENMDFRYADTNKATRKKIVRTITDLSAKRSIADMVLARVGPEKQKSEVSEDQLYVKKARQFADLMDKMTAMDPERRVTAHDGLSHTFVAEAGPGSKPKEQDQDSRPKTSKTHHHSEGKSGKK
eukprot:TRINITY_DN27597_c0_g1_i1.p1 TRINITY_DN27597_c0_g1~~TRINITY_DN27597_c0_g1_i1.p1  ORF type:complete len:621 (+),score=160.74 TRINITY_DN27597_c0_g1_i1:115-1977(+)